MISIRMLWVKCTTSGECKPIRIAESSVMEGWKDHYIAQCRFWFLKNGFRNIEESAGRSNRRVLPWHGKSLEYLEGIVKNMEVVMCD
jgi:hypothetical protein